MYKSEIGCVLIHPLQKVYRRSQVRSSNPATFFCGDWSQNHLYDHSLHIADSSTCNGSFQLLPKVVHRVLASRLRLSLAQGKRLG